MLVKNVSFSASPVYEVSRVEIKLDNGDTVSVFIGTDGQINLRASYPNKHGTCIPNKGVLVKVSDYEYPSD